MSKRFGRNQRRKLQNELAAMTYCIKYQSCRIDQMTAEVCELNKKLDEAIVFDIECLRSDFAGRAFELKATAHQKHRDPYYMLQVITETELKYQRDIDSFFHYVSQKLAKALKTAIGQQYEGKPFKFEERLRRPSNQN